jgi:hypothetical protein
MLLLEKDFLRTILNGFLVLNRVNTNKQVTDKSVNKCCQHKHPTSIFLSQIVHSAMGTERGCRVVLCGFAFEVGVRDFSLLKNVKTNSGAHPFYYGVSLREGK